MEYCMNQESEKEIKENLEVTLKIRQLIEKLLIKQGLLLFGTEKTKYYNLSKFMISVYEDNYKFEIDIINQETFKINKIYGEREEKEIQYILSEYTKFIDSIYKSIN